jgi:phage terminase large subunit
MALHTDLRALKAEVGELLATHDRARSLDAFAKYVDDPVGFILTELDADPEMFWSRQREIAELVRDNRYVVVRSCNGLGKDWLAARLALWWVYCRRGYVLITGPTERQVKHVVMGQVRRAFNAAADLPGSLYELALRLDGSEEMGILAFTSTDASKLTGFHAPRLMVLITEAQGIEPLVWEATFANVTGEESRIVAVGNPLQPTGKFFEVSRSPNWSSVKISALEHPNVVQQREVVPGAVSKGFIDTIATEYGVGSGVYQSRVLGEFPDESDDTLCQRSWIIAANQRWQALRSRPRLGRPEFALDPARYGPDSSVLAVGYGDAIEELVTWSKLGMVETAGRVVAEMERFGVTRMDARTVDCADPGWRHVGGYTLTVDEVGLGGGAVDVLREMRIRVNAYNGGRSPDRSKDVARFRNCRARDYWNLRRRLELGTVALPPDDKLADELCSMRWRTGMDGKIEIEAKDDLRGRLGRSPDRADAVAMIFSFDGRGHIWVA